MIQPTNLVSEGKTERIPISKLTNSYNLPLDYLKRVSAISSVEQDDLHIPAITVVRRDGINYIVDGQHTVEMVTCVTGLRDTPILCRVYEDISSESEAEIFGTETGSLSDEEARR